MKCPSCGYVSFDDTAKCKKCGAELNRAPAEDIISFASDDLLFGVGQWAPVEEATGAPAEVEFKVKETKQATDPTRESPKASAKKTASPSPPESPVVIESPSDENKEDFLLELKKTAADEFFEGLFERSGSLAEPEGATPAPEPIPAVPVSEPIREVVREEDFAEDFRIDLDEPILEEAFNTDGAREEESVAVFLPEESQPIENLREVPAAFLGETPAGLGRRTGAFLVDNAVILLVLALFVAGAGVGLYLKGASTAWLLSHLWAVDALLPFFLLSAIISGTYFVSQQWREGRTLGKRLFSLRVVTDEGETLSLPTSVFRWMGYLVSAVPLGLGFFWAVFGRDGLTWHDRLSGTRVVEEAEESS